MTTERLIIFHGQYFQDFYLEQSDKIREKIGYVFRVVKTVDKIPGKFLKHMEGTDGFMKLELKLVATSSESSAVLTKEI